MVPCSVAWCRSWSCRVGDLNCCVDTAVGRRAVVCPGLDPELYVIPWMESLFADNVTMEDALRVWDILLALDARFVPFLCVASITQVSVALV